MAGAIKAIIATQFDATGIRNATKEFNKLGSSIKGTLGAIGIGVGLASLATGLKEATKQASNDNKAQILLAQQLRNTADASDVQIASVEKSIAQMAIQTAVADDQLRPALASLVRATGDVGQAQNLLALSLDVSAATGKDLQSVSLAIGKAVAGQTSQLFRMIPALKGSDDWMGKLQESTKGMALAAGNADPFMRLQIIFDEIQETIGFAVLPALQDFANWMASPEGQGKTQEFVDTLVAAVKVLVDFANFVSQNIGVFGSLAAGIGGTTIAIGLFNLALNTNPIFLFVGALGALATALQALQPNINAAANGVPTAVNRAASKVGQAAYEKALRDKSNYEMTATGPKLKTGAAIKAEQARMAAFQAEIDKYKAGIKKADDAAKSSTTFSPFVPSTTTGSKTGSKAKSAAQVALEKAQKALDSFKESLKGMGDLSSLTTISKDVGEFEQSVMDTFSEIYKKIAEMPAKTKGLDTLKKTLASYNALLLENAKQRDAIIKKRGLAQALIDDVKSTLMGSGNLASLLETQTQSVTTSVTKIVDGFTVTTKRTVDEVIGGKGVVSKLKEVVAKTKAFAAQLTSLKAAGLDPDLFKQIVDAGPDVGSQLAKEILDGGSDSVKALNTTFGELRSVTADVAEQTAVVMYNAGVDVAGGLVNGLLSQEEALVNAAKTLADAFNAAYQENIKALEVPNAPTVTPKTTGTTTNVTNKITLKQSPVTPKKDGQALVSAINKYTVPNGFTGSSYRGLLK